MTYIYNTERKDYLPNLFCVNVTASKMMSIGVVRHNIYLTDSLRISEHKEKRAIT